VADVNGVSEEKRLFCEQQQGTGVHLNGGHAEYMLDF
jgi:hypothetical protein